MATKAIENSAQTRAGSGGTAKRRIRKVFGDIHEVVQMPNLIEVQRESYEQFLRSDKSDPLVAPCRIGKLDIGLWLLAQGWVKPEPSASDDYRKAAEAAHCAGLGLWREAGAPPACASLN